MAESLSFRTRLVVAGFAALAVVAVVLWRAGRTTPTPKAPVLTVVAAGDVVATEAPTRRQRHDASSVVAILGRADAAIANLEVSLAEQEDASSASNPRWPRGSKTTIELLRALGVTIVSRANNHALDDGRSGFDATTHMLDAAALLHVGSGVDLEAARRPVIVGERPRRVAVIAVAASAAPETRASAPRGDIAGRPGVNPLRYTTQVVADPATFATLKSTAATLGTEPSAAGDSIELFGTRITKGDRTEVRFDLDQSDLADVTATIGTAAANADAVVVSVHSHEPSNDSDAPAEFLRRFARAAIDAGAALVVGHGPHRVRGVERHGKGAIVYSVGNFLFQDRSIDPRAADVFESGADLYRAAIGSLMRDEAPPLRRDDPVWWQGLIVEATFDGGALGSLTLHPIDLGIGESRQSRGWPRLASPEMAASILRRVQNLSRPLSTPIDIDGSRGMLRLQ